MSTPPSSFTTPTKDPHRRRSEASWQGSGGEPRIQSRSLDVGSTTTSPTTGSTTTISDLASSASTGPTIHRFTESARIAALRNVSTAIFTLQGTPPRRKPVIRADPMMLSCFDVADKELYDLWVPKQ